MDKQEQIRELDKRSIGGAISKQPRYNDESDKGGGGFVWQDLWRWGGKEMPAYSFDNRERDKWQIEFLAEEAHLNAIIRQVASLIANRGWNVTGGRNTVNLVRNILHDSNRDEDARFGRGYRNLQRKGATAYHTTNLGAIFEMGRDGRTTDRLVPPLAALWNVDPTRCRLTKNSKEPLEYFPPSGSSQKWLHSDYFKVTANPSIEDAYGDLGYCTVAIVLELAQILIKLYRHDNEMLDAASPTGLLLLRGVTRRAWENAMKERKQKMAAKEQKYFGGTMVIPTIRADMPPEANLLALSQIPEGFDRQEAITMLIYLISAAVEFPPEEFWPVQTGQALGRSVETATQFERATDKGDASYFLVFQELLQRELPSAGTNNPIVLFEFEERSDKGREIEAEVERTYAEIATMLYESGLQQGDPLLSKQQVLTYLVNKQVLDPSVTDAVEQTQADDTQVVRARERARSSFGVWTQARYIPQEPIIYYEWPSGRETILWSSGFDMTQPAVWRGYNVTATSLQILPKVEYKMIGRQDVLYEDEDVIITEDDLQQTVEESIPAIIPFLEAEEIE